MSACVVGSVEVDAAGGYVICYQLKKTMSSSGRKRNNIKNRTVILFSFHGM